MSSNGEHPASDTAATDRHFSLGPLLAIGGAEETEPGGEILERFVSLAGSDDARILIIPTASEDPKRSGDGYVELFYEIGAGEADWLRVEEREQACEAEPLEQVRHATGIFITGGDQARLVQLLVGTPLMEELQLRNANGIVVGGTSAGASILSALMMAGGTGTGGNSNDATARKGMVETVAGFGLVWDVIIDQHFSQRGRMGRLLSAFAANPGLVGIGLDEDTAVHIDTNGTFEVLGSNMVTVVDGREATSDYFEREDGEVLTVTKSSLHVLAAGRHFDLHARQVAEMDGHQPDSHQELAPKAPEKARS
jgi:cyanophycinase